jgi:hypothetical protein
MTFIRFPWGKSLQPSIGRDASCVRLLLPLPMWRKWALASCLALAATGAAQASPSKGVSLAIGLDAPPAGIASGTSVELRVPFSISGSSASGVVVWVALDVTPAQDFGQDERLQFVSATSGGSFTATDLVVSGATVPAGSVYWDFGSLSAGTRIVRPTLRVPPGALNASVYRMRAFVRNDGNGAFASSPERTAAATAIPMPAIAIGPGTGWVDVDGVPQAAPGGIVQFVVGAPAGGSNNGPGNGVETLYQARAWVALQPLCALDASLPAACIARASDVSDGGTVEGAFDPDAGGPLSAQPAVVWEIPALVPGVSFERRFRFSIPAAAADGVLLELDAALDSARTATTIGTRTFRIGIDETPQFAFALGDNVGGTLVMTPGVDDNPTSRLAFEDEFDLGLSIRNSGAVALGDALLFVRVPLPLELRAVDLPQGVAARAFHSSSAGFNDPAIPPPSDLTAAIGNAQLPADIDIVGNQHWAAFDAQPPVSPAMVRWVAIYLTDLAVGTDADIARVRLRNPTPSCAITDVQAGALVRVHAFTPSGGSEQPLPLPVPSSLDVEIVRALDPPPQLHLSAGGANVDTVGDAKPAQIDFTVSNMGPRSIDDTSLVLTWPTLSLDGVPTRPEFVAASGGEVDASDAADGEVGILIDPIAPGTSRVASVSLRYPSGIVANATHAVRADARSEGIGCGGADADATRTLLLLGAASLQIETSAEQATLAPGGDIAFGARLRNSGTAVATAAFAYGPVPEHATFRRAELPVGRRLRCSAPPLDVALPDSLDDPGFIFDADVFANQFVEGTFGTEGWTCPRGGATTWIALELDDASLSPPSLVTGSDEAWRLLLRNDEVRDEPDGLQQASLPGTVVEFELAMLADGLLPVRSNAVSATVVDDTIQADCEPPPLLTLDPYDYAIAVTNAVAPVDFSLVGGSLPGCVVLDADGRFHGSASVVGDSVVSVRIVDGAANAVDVECTLRVVESGVFGDGLEATPRTPVRPPDPCD